LPGYEVRSWFGMFAPAKTPPSVVDRLSREIKQASTDPKFMAALAPQGMQIIASSPAEMGARRCVRISEMGRRHPGNRHHDQSINQGHHDAPPFAATDCPVM